VGNAISQLQPLVKPPSLSTAELRVDRSRRFAQVATDHDFMRLAWRMRESARCRRCREGAILALDGKLVYGECATAPTGFDPCVTGGCAACSDADGTPSGRCICVHAETSVLATAARVGRQVSGATLYTTSRPCFECLRLAVHAGVSRIVYLDETTIEDLPASYTLLVERLRRSDPHAFERLVDPDTFVHQVSTSSVESARIQAMSSPSPSQTVHAGAVG
jgi:dCMP deaminase